MCRSLAMALPNSLPASELAFVLDGKASSSDPAILSRTQFAAAMSSSGERCWKREESPRFARALTVRLWRDPCCHDSQSWRSASREHLLVAVP
jgi:hypothetical protein